MHVIDKCALFKAVLTIIFNSIVKRYMYIKLIQEITPITEISVQCAFVKLVVDIRSYTKQSTIAFGSGGSAAMIA